MNIIDMPILAPSRSPRIPVENRHRGTEKIREKFRSEDGKGKRERVREYVGGSPGVSMRRRKFEVRQEMEVRKQVNGNEK